MKRFTWIFAVLFLFFASSAFAAWWNPVSWVKAGLEAGGWTLVAYLVTALLGLAVIGTAMFIRIINTMKEAGELLIVLSEALADRKVTPDEIKTIIADIRDVMNVWKNTSNKYKPE